jgi:hypothetical protein
MEPGSYTLRPTQWLTFSFFFYWLDTGELPPIDKDNTDIWYFILRAYHFACERSVGTVFQLPSPDAIYSRDEEKERKVGRHLMFVFAHGPRAAEAR